MRDSVEETLSELMGAESEKLTQAARYERNEQPQGYRISQRLLQLQPHTTFENATTKVPRLQGISFETAVIGR